MNNKKRQYKYYTPASNNKNAKQRHSDMADILVQLRKDGQLDLTNEKVSLKKQTKQKDTEIADEQNDAEIADEQKDAEIDDIFKNQTKQKNAEIAKMLVQLRKNGQLELTNGKLSLKDPSKQNINNTTGPNNDEQSCICQ